MSEPPALTLEDLQANPMEQFMRWFAAAAEALGREGAQAMCLSTIDPQGLPEGRMMLLKQADGAGFVFYTNQNSNKGQSLEETPRAALTFFWGPQLRQVRVQGNIEKVADADADAYFQSRPRLSQIGAWASLQSAVLDRRETLDARVAEFSKKYEGQDVPRPPYWNGYRVAPSRIEFWQGRPNRLHDRFVYRRDRTAWVIERLYP